MAKPNKTYIADDLQQARKKGQSYNKYHADRAKESYDKGAVSKKGVAYEMYSPKEVKASVEGDPAFYEARKQTDIATHIKNISNGRDGVADNGDKKKKAK